MFRSWWKRHVTKQTAGTTTRRPSRRPRVRRPLLEVLEDRTLPAVSPFQAVLPLALVFPAPPAGPAPALPGLDLVPAPGTTAAALRGQVFFLDLGGARGVRYGGPVAVDGIDVPALRAPAALAGQEAAIRAALLADVRHVYAGTGVTFTTQRPAAGDYSTIYVGGTGAAFARYGNYLGLAERVDAGNADPRDAALVFSARIAPSAATPQEYAGAVAAVVAHEAAHLLGYRHAQPGAAGDPLAAVAFKPQTHVQIAKDVRDDLLADGRVTIAGHDYAVDPRVVAAIRDYPAYYYGGTVGPDGFPDLVFGQGTLHPVDTGIWLQRVLDMAWAAQTSDAWSPVEKSQILAWSYGFLTHAAGDFWAHTLVNEFSEGVFPPFVTLVQNDRDLANAVRHFMVESYVADATPGIDNNADRTVLPDGDVSDDSSPSLPYAVPSRFVYEALIQQFPGQPTDTRGKVIDSFVSLQDGLRQKAQAAGLRPAESFDDLLQQVFQDTVNGQTIPPDTLNTLYRAYLYNWIDSIDDGLQHWGDLGLAVSRGLFDPQSRRDLQNREGAPQGADAGARRGDTEAGVGLLDVVVAQLDDPNGDGNTDDSFINNHLLPMLGVPPQLAALRTTLQTFGNTLDQEIVGPLRLAFNPILDAVDKLEDIPKEFVENLVEEHFGIDIDQLEELSDLASKMDLASITVPSPAGGSVTLPIFKPDAHARLDALMGIQGAALAEPLTTATQVPGLTFYPGATGQLDGNVEFDKQKFAAYANAVTLSKLLLLQENPVGGETVGAGALSQFFSDQLGQPYDFSLLNLNGDNGGNILLATLPRPGVTVPVIQDGDIVGQAPSDTRPGIVSIDTDHGWRDDSQTVTTDKFRHHAPATDGAAAVWAVTGLTPGVAYTVQASWLANVRLTPATNATYRVFDGDPRNGPLLGTFTVNQQQFASEVEDDGVFFNGLGQFTAASGTLTVVLGDDADGEVIAGPVRVVAGDSGAVRLVEPARDANDDLVSQADGYSEQGDGWEDLKYRTGTGNFAFWESDLLRPVFRKVFVDWQDGGQAFPDLGDAASRDPNEDVSIPASPIAALVTPFDPAPVAGLPAGLDLVVSGATTQTLSGDLVLGRVTGDGDAVPDSLTLVVDGQVLLTEDVAGGGLAGLNIQATGGIRVAPGVTVSTRQFTGDDPLTAPSTGDSGDLTLAAPDIAVGAGARLLAQADGTFHAGNVTLTANVTPPEVDWFLGIQGFQISKAEATIDVGAGATLEGNDITLGTITSTSKSATLTQDLAPGAESELAQPVDEPGLVPFATTAAAVFSRATSRVTVGEGAVLDAGRNVTLDAEAASRAAITTQGRYLGATYASSSPTATVTVLNGARLLAGGDLDVLAQATNDLNVTTVVPGAGDVANVSFSYGKANSISKADLQAGSTVRAQNAHVLAQNLNSFSNQALAAGFSNSGSAGVGATVVLGSYTSAATASVSGDVAVGGDLTVDSKSVNAADQSRAFAAVLNPAVDSPLLEEVKNFLAGVSLSQDIDGQTILPAGGNGPGVAVGGAVAIIQSDNKAASLLADGSLIVVGGKLGVTSQAVDPFQASATGSAGDANRVSVGGAVAWSEVSNQATSFVGYDAVVDVALALRLTADATVPSATAPFDPALTITHSNTAAGAARVQEQYADGVALGAAVKGALTPQAGYVGTAAPGATTVVHAGGEVDPDGRVSVAGGVNVLALHNEGVAAIAAGARVNQRLGTAPGQDVTLDATGTVQVVSLAGTDSGLDFGTGTGTGAAAAGGYFNGLFLDNHARAYLDDRTQVAAGNDVALHATTTTQVLADGQAGSAAQNVGVSGAVNVVSLTGESLAFVEDRANVRAGHDLDLTADNHGLVVNVTGGVAAGQVVGVGVSGSFTTIHNTTQAFVGNSGGPVGPGGTGGEVGSVSVGHDLNAGARSDQEVWAVAVAGAGAAGVARGAGGVQQAQGLKFGFGVSGDVALNRLADDAEAFVSDVPAVTVGGNLALTAHDGTALTAAAGAVAFGNDVGLGGSFATNGIDRTTRAYTQDTGIASAGLGLLADTADQVVTLSDGGGGATADASVAGSVNLNRLTNVTEAVLGPGTTAQVSGAASLHANDATDLNSVAGATSAGNSAFLAVGAALDLGTLDKQAHAFVAGDATLQAGGTVTVNAISDESVLSVSAAQAAASLSGQPTRLYHNTGSTVTPFGASQAITGDDSLVTSVALGDVDGDGKLDLVTGNFAQFNRVYLNDGTGHFAAGKDIGTDLVAALKAGDLPSGDQLAHALVPDLTMAVALTDLNGDGFPDVIAGNLGQPNRVYLNNGKGKFLPGIAIGQLDLPVTLDPAATQDNRTPDDLAADVQAAVSRALRGAGLDPGDVTVSVGADGRILLTSTSRVLDAAAAAAAIAAARRGGVLVTADGGPLSFVLHLSDSDLTRAIAVGDVNGDHHPDILAGNLNQHNRLYLNDGTGHFGVGFDVSPDVSLTTSVALADVNNDGSLDLVAGNVHLDLGALVNQGLVTAQDFVKGTLIDVAQLVQNTAVTLLDLLKSDLLSRFDFNGLTDVPIGDLVQSGLADLQDLVRAGLLHLGDFADVVLSASGLVNSGLVTQAALAANNLIDALGNVSLDALVNSGLTTLGQLLRVNLVGLGDLNLSDLTLGDLLQSGVATIDQLVQAGLVKVTDLVRNQLDLHALLDSGLVKLQDLVDAGLLSETDLDLSKLDPTTLTAGLKAGGPTRLYLNDGTGHFGPGTDVTTDQAVTLSVAVGDVNGDGKPDLVLGNSGTPNRLYLNDGTGHFGPGRNVSSDFGLTQQVLLGDVNGDGSRDLVVAKLGQPNRVYFNDGQGNFGPAVNIGTESDVTTGVALGDVDGDGRQDVIAGNARPNVGAAGSGSSLRLAPDVEAAVQDGASVTTPQSLFVTVDDQAAVANLVGAAASGSTLGVGLSAGRTEIDRTAGASVGAADVTALGQGVSGPLLPPTGLVISATAGDDLLSYGAGQAKAGDLGVAASAVNNTLHSSTTATVGDGARVNQANAGAATGQDVRVNAQHTTDVLGIAGSFAGATHFGVGAALDAELLTKDVRATVAPSALVNADGSVLVSAGSRDSVGSVVAGAVGAGDVSIDGSVSFVRPQTTTTASVGGTVDAEGNVVVTAARDLAVAADAGAASFGGNLGVSASAAALLDGSDTEASVAPGATVRARGNRGATSVVTGAKDPRGVSTTQSVLGLWVGAAADVVALPVVAGGADAGKVGAAGSLVFTVLDDTTRAFAGAGAQLNVFAPGDTDSNTDADVQLVAVSDTSLLDQAGASVTRDLLGAGAGVDFVSITKTTEAVLDGTADANRDVTVLAFSDEEVASVTGTTGLNFVASIGGAAGACAVDATTRAEVAPGAHVRAVGSVVVNADDSTQVDVTAGSTDVAIGGAAGASVGAVVLNKTTESFIGDGADVTALGAKLGAGSEDGRFFVQFVPDAPAPGQVPLPGVLDTLLDVLAAVFDNPVRTAVGDAVSALLSPTAGAAVAGALDITAVGAPPDDPTLSQRREVTPELQTVFGVAVTASNRDDVRTLTVGLGAGALALPQLSAPATVSTDHTSAFVGKNARVNQDETGAAAPQSVIVAAGSDSYHLDLAGLANAGLLSVGPAGALAVIANVTEAFVATGALVNAQDQVAVRAAATEDVVLAAAGASAAAGITLAGSFPVFSLDNRTHAFVDAAATVNSGGSVLVAANDDTDAHLIGGDAALGLGAGFGTSAGLTVLTKDTQAWIGQAAVVNALALHGADLAVFEGPIDDTLGLVQEDIAGVGVQASSTEHVFTAVGSGATGAGVGLAGALVAVLGRANTAAFIDANARVNGDTPGASSFQSVNVAAADDAQVFDVAANLLAGNLALAGGVDLALLRNSTNAWIAPGAQVSALQDVDVHALSRENTSSFVAGAGATAGLGLVASVSLHALRADIGQSILGFRPGDFLNGDTAGTVQDYLDGQVFQLTAAAGSGLGGVLGGLGDLLGPSAQAVAGSVQTAAPTGAVTEAVTSTDVGPGNKATINGATINAGRDVNVSAAEKLTTTQDTSFTFNFSLGKTFLPPVTGNSGVLDTAGSAEAAIEGGATVTAGRDVLVSGSVGQTSSLAATAALNATANTVRGSIDDATVTATRDVNVTAASQATADYAALLPGFGSMRIKFADNQVRNVIDAHIAGADVTAGGGVAVTATDQATLSVIANATALTKKGLFNVAAIGASVVINDVADRVTAHVERSTVSARAGAVQVTATATPTITAVAVGVVVSGDNTAAGSTAINTIANTVDADIADSSDVRAARSLVVSAHDTAAVVAFAGGASGAFDFAALGGSFAQNTITNDVTATLGNSSATAPVVEFVAREDGGITAIAAGGAGAEDFAAGGSVSLNTLGSTVDAHVGTGGTVRASSLLLVSATDGATIKALTGGAAGAGVVGIGAAFSTNTISDTVGAYLDGATVTDTGAVQVQATGNGQVQATTGAGAGSGTFVLVGSAALNTITDNLDAHVSGSTVSAGGAVSLAAQDTAGITALAGMIAGTGSTALGGAGGTNDIGSALDAFIDASTVTTASTVTLTATASPAIHALAAGAGGSGTVAVTGGVSLNQMHETVRARVVGGATVTATQGVTLTAQDGTDQEKADIQSLAGQATGAGAAGIGAAAAYNNISNTVQALVDGATVTAPAGSVALSGVSTAAIQTVAAGGGLSLVAGIAGSVAVNVLGNTVEAFLHAATVTAANNLTLLADANDSSQTLAGTLGLAAVGLDGSVVVNELGDTTRAYAEDSAVVATGAGAATGVERFDPDTGAETVQQARGLAVVATSTEAVTVKAVTAAVTTGVGISGNVSVTTAADTTEAFLRGSTVNSAENFGQAVIVRAHQDTGLDVFGGGGSLGLGVAVGGAVDTTQVHNATRAFISDHTVTTRTGPVVTPGVVHARGVEISGTTRERVNPTVVGVAVGGFALAGAIPVEDIASTNDAFVQRSDVFSQGDLQVLADDTAAITPQAGVLAAGLFGGGGSVAVNSIRNTTRARALGASLNATGATAVAADIDETITTKVGTAAAGGIALAGAVSVDTIEATTEATTAGFGTRATLVNQDPAFRPGGAFAPGAGQTFRLAADDTAGLTGTGGTASVGLLGVGASIDVGAVRDRTVAQVGAGTQIFAQGNLTVSSHASRDLGSTAVALGGGLAGISGAISVVSLGAAADGTATTEFDRVDSSKQTNVNTLRKQVNADLAVRTPALNTRDAGVAAAVQADVNALPDPTVDAALSTTASTDDRITGALVESATASALGAALVSGGSISVSATNLYDVDSTAGQGGLGLLTAGTSISRVAVHNQTQAAVGSFGVLQAAGSVGVSASDQQDPAGGQSTTRLVSGALAIFSLAASDSQFNLTDDTDAHLAANAVVRGAGAVSVTANHQADVDADARGLTVAGAAEGSISNSIDLGGTVEAYLGGGARVGDTQSAGSLIVAATADSKANALIKAGAGGVLFAGQENSATATVHPTLQAALNNGSLVDVTGDATLRSDFTGGADAEADGVTIGAGAVGKSTATTRLTPSLTTSVNAATVFAGGGVTVESVSDGTPASATANASGGGALSGNGAVATSTASATVGAFLDPAAVVHAGETVAVHSAADNEAVATGDGSAFGVVGVGGAQATATAAGTISAHIDGDVQAGNVSVEAVGINVATAGSDAASGGAVGANSGDSSAFVSPTIRAYVEGTGVVNAGNNVLVRADATTDADATVNGVSAGGVTIGNSSADVHVTPTVEGSVRSAAQVAAGGSVTVESRQGHADGDTDGSFDAASGVFPATDLIQFTDDPRLTTNDPVVYSRGLNRLNTIVGGLTSGRTYNALPNIFFTTALGAEFDAEQVDPLQDVIRFGGPHHLLTGDRVIYHSNGNTPLGGLTDGGTYFVRVLDDHTIKLAPTLAAAQASSQTFASATVSSAADTITLPNHGFTAGQAVTYRAPAAQTFSSRAVDVSTGANGLLQPDAAADTIRLPGHGFTTGQQVTYRTGGPAVGGLVNGGSYFVIRVDADTIRLASSLANANAGVALALDPSAAPRDVVQSLALSGDAPVRGLVDGQTYYVLPVDADHFQLAATPGGTALSLDATGLTGTHRIGAEGIDLATSVGRHQLVIDITGAGTGTQQLTRDGDGLNLVAPPSGLGISLASAKGSSTSAVGTRTTTATAAASPDVDAFVGGSARVTAGADVRIASTSDVDAGAQTLNKGGAFFSNGNGQATATFAPTNSAHVDGSATVVAGGDFSLLADSGHEADVSADSAGGGGITVATANATANIQENTTAVVGAGAHITAANNLTVQATSDLHDTADADAGAKGVAAAGAANDDRNSSALHGVLLGSTTTPALTQTLIGTNAQLTARNVDLIANLKTLFTSASSFAKSDGAVADPDAVARVQSNTKADTTIQPGAQVRGTDTLDIEATHGQGLVRSFVSANTTTFSAGSDSDANAVNSQVTTSHVGAAAGATLTTHNLTVRADTDLGTFATSASHSGGFIELGDENKTTSQTASRQIDFNADAVILGGPDPELIVNEAGTVVRRSNLTTTDSGTRITVGNVANAGAGSALFDIPPIDGQQLGALNGTASTFTFRDTFENVHILNRSAKELQINNIDVVNRTATPQVKLSVERVNGLTFGTTVLIPPFTFDVARGFNPTAIDIEIQSAVAAPGLFLNGLIDNPLGQTTVVNARGDVISLGTQAVLRANSLDIEAALGNVGTSAARVNAELVQSAGRPTHLAADAGQDVHLNLKGRLRDAAASALTVGVDGIDAGGDVDLRLQQGVRESALPALAYQVSVQEPLVPRTSTVTTHFRPPASPPPVPLALGLFGTSPVSLAALTSFALVEAGGNLDIASDTTTARAVSGQVGVRAGGSVSLTNLSGQGLQATGGTGNNLFTLTNWSGTATLDGGAGTDSLALNSFSGTVTTVEALNLTGTVSTAAAATPATLAGSLALPATVVFNVAAGAAAQDLVVSAVLTGAGGLTKQGAGTLALTAANGYTGTTRIDAGTLQVNGSQPRNAVLLNGGTLGGTGTTGAVSASPVAGSKLAPGLTAAGQLSTSNLTLNANAAFVAQLNGTAAGTGFDVADVRGTVNLGGATLQASLGFASAVGDSFVVIRNDGTDAVTGTFAGLAEGATFLVGSVQFHVSYRGGDGNDVVLVHDNTNAAFAERTVTSPIDENGVAVLTGRPVDADPLDNFILLVNWGDGSAGQRFEFPPSTPSVRLEHRYLDSRATAYPVSLQWLDQHGGGNSDRLAVVVNNLAPALALDGPAGGVRGQRRTLLLRADDPSPVDQAAAFTYRVSWGDGTVDTFGGSAVTAAGHVYARTGTYTVQATATDKDGGASAVAARVLTIQAAALEDGTLAVGGTTGNDVIRVQPAGVGGALRVLLNGRSLGTFLPTAGLEVYGQAGDDVLTVEARRIGRREVTVNVPVLLDGGAGNDRLNAAGAAAGAVLLGRDGDDVLLGGRGRDLLIGGRGRDVLSGDPLRPGGRRGGEDILIGGSTVHDDSTAALDALMAEWRRTDLGRRARERHLLGQGGTGVNGDFLLSADALLDDGAVDRLFSLDGSDWLLPQGQDVVRGQSVPAGNAFRRDPGAGL